MLMQKNLIALNAISYDKGEFAEESLRKQFSTYHAGKARLLLVHPTANLSWLKYKENEDLGRCEMCRKIDHLLLTETFNDLRVDKPLCPKCRANLGQCAACEKIIPVKHIEK
jgi:predicted RNA-binding Zn-ribbon protein involved in translation (DUF1610 family)